MPQVTPWPLLASDREVAAFNARALLEAGRLVGVPTETAYVVVAAAGNAEAAARLKALGLPVTRTPDSTPWTGVAGRLARRSWPGPLVIRLADDPVAYAEPAFDCFRQVATMPVLMAEAGPCFTAESLVARVPDLPMVLDAGRTPLAVMPTVVAVREQSWKVERVGSLDVEEVARLAARWTLFVCTGNTCRSPMAEAIFRSLLAKRLGCSQDELLKHGHIVLSAGVAAGRGEPATAEAAEAVKAWEGDLSRHASRPVNPMLLAEADDVIAMTTSHLMMVSRQPGLKVRPRLLCKDRDLPDPIGGGREVYENCARVIRDNLEPLVAEVAD